MDIMKQGINQLITEKQALETRLRTMIAEELSAFVAMTGASVDSVSIDMVTVRPLGAAPQHFVAAVRLNIPLD